MDRLDERYATENSVNGGVNKNADKVGELVEVCLKGAADYFERAYTDLHRLLADIICDVRSGDRDIVDGHMDVSIYLQSVLKPSLHHICEGNALEMRRLTNLIADGGYLRC